MSSVNFTLDTTSKIKLYHQLYDKFVEEIKSGALKPKTKLPSIRQIAEDLGVSKNTVTKAYAQLEKSGFIYAEEKRGYFVNNLAESTQDNQIENQVDAEEQKIESDDSSIPTVESILKQRRSNLLPDEMPPAPPDLSTVIADSLAVVQRKSVPTTEETVPTVQSIAPQVNESVPIVDEIVTQPAEAENTEPIVNETPQEVKQETKQEINQEQVAPEPEKINPPAPEPEPETKESTIQTLVTKICTHVLQNAGTATQEVYDPFGELYFRKAIASFLNSYLDIKTSPEQIVVSSDSSHLLKSILALQTIREPFEKSNGMGLLKLANKLSSGSATPIKAMTGLSEGTDEKIKQIFSKSRLPYREIPSDELGLNPQNPENAESTSIFIVPGDLKPLTTGDSKERLWKILDWSYQISYRHIIEYDTLPLFREPEHVRIKTSDLQGKVIYINSFENLLWGGLKAAFAVLPSTVCADYKQYYDYLPCPLSLLEQQILTEFINSGNLEQLKRGLYGKEKNSV